MEYMLDRVGIYSIDSVLPFIVKNKKSEGAIRNYDGHPVKMWSLRYHVFKKSLICVNCGIKGEYLALEKSKYDNGDKFHFNLYAKTNDSEVLITKDHIIPKSKGGRLGLNNLQTMCKVCNEMKSNKPELIGQ